MPLQIRRGTDAERSAMTQPLAAGELIYVTDTQRLFVGNGATVGGVGITGYTDSDAQDAAATVLTNNANHTGISFSYNGTTNEISASVDLSAFEGLIEADLKGSVFADDSTLLVDAVSGRIVGPVFSNVTGNVVGNVTGNVVGNVTGNSEGYHTGDVNGSIFADDSTLLVDGVSSIIVGDVNNASVTTNSLILPGPLSGITIVTEGTVEDNYSLFVVSIFQSTADPTAATYLRGRGTEAAPAIIQAGDSIFHNIFLGLTNANPGQAAVIEVNVDPNGTVADNIVPGQINLKTFNNAGLEVIGLGLNRNGEITVADNVLSAGASPGNVNDSAAVSYLKITVGATTYAMPLYAIRP